MSPVTVPLPGTGTAPRDNLACQDGDVIEIGADASGVPRNGAVRAA
jgi:hypothetical protein